MVPRSIYVKVAGDFYDPEYMVEHNSLYTVCVGLNGKELYCLDQIFDEINIHLFDEKENEKENENENEKENEKENENEREKENQYISAAFCVKSSNDCLCNISILVKCCSVSSPVIQSNSELLSDNTIHDVKQLENKLAKQLTHHVTAPPPWACMDRDNVKYIIGVKSASTHAKVRNLMREGWMTTYGSLWEKYNVCAAFIIGHSQYPEYISSYLQLERKYHHDTLLGDEVSVKDSYYNLHTKSRLFMRWALNRQSILGSVKPLRYVIMIDDDVYIHLPRLLSLLALGSGVRDYRGEVFADKFNNQFKPIRDPDHRNFLSTDDFPNKFLPRYATGNFYMLSVDLAHFIVNRGEDFSTIGSLEDVTFAVWLSKIAVYPLHTTGVVSLDEFADKVGMRLWESESALPPTSPLCEEIFCIFNSDNDVAQSTIMSMFSKCDGNVLSLVEATSRTNILNVKSHRRKRRIIIVYITDSASWATEVVSALLTESFPSLIFQFYLVTSVSQRGGRRYSIPPGHEQSETSRYPDIFVISSVDEGIRDESKSDQLCHYKNKELGGYGVEYDGLLTWRDNCQQYIRESIEEINAENVLFINGEAVNIANLSSYLDFSHTPQNHFKGTHFRNYVILNGFKHKGVSDQIASVRRGNNNVDIKYLPNAATSFALTPSYMTDNFELITQDMDNSLTVEPLMSGVSLTNVRGRRWAASRLAEKSREVAYLYFRCDRPAREKMFNLLWSHDVTVDALGACGGHGYHRDVSKNDFNSFVSGRFSPGFAPLAIKMYKPYKFVIAFENTVMNGYITEKLTNAFLAHSVPIYYGAPDVGHYFNKQSFIDCRDFENIESCAAHVQRVSKDDSLYLSYLEAEPIKNVTNWCDFFQWQPIVRQDSRCNKFFQNNDITGNDITLSISNTFTL